ncbi:MAG TPA: hypothetical protein P5513_02560 [Candidatus Diapherotrites archaeon]|nr:hypothetical protein [Candidatus Diapherotrites archaeon]
MGLKNYIKQQKAQAALVDSLFFLTIITALAVFMFQYSSTYGDRVDLAAKNLYFKEYASSTLKTIFYSEVPLNFSKDINNTDEIDYLMITIEADYFPDKKIGVSDINTIEFGNDGDIAKFNLYALIKSVMNPLPTYDYLFYLYDTRSANFNYFLIKITPFEESTQNSGDIKNPYQKIYSPGNYKYYLCDPDGYSVVRDIVSGAGQVYSSSIPLNFRPKSSEGTRIVATFTMWPANASIQPKQLETATMKCKEINQDDEKLFAISSSQNTVMQ